MSLTFPHGLNNASLPAAVNFNDFKDPEDVLPLTHEAVGIPRRIAQETVARMQVGRRLGSVW